MLFVCLNVKFLLFGALVFQLKTKVILIAVKSNWQSIGSNTFLLTLPFSDELGKAET